MNTQRAEDYVPRGFAITTEDLNRVAALLARAGTPQDLKTIALSVLKARMEHGHDLSPVVSLGQSTEVLVRFWEPGSEWETGDVVLLVHDPFGNSKFQLFVGVVEYVDTEVVEIQMGELQCTKTYLRTLPGTENAHQFGSASESWREIVIDLAEKKLRSGDPDEEAEGRLLQDGERILTCLVKSLRQDARFIGLADKWYLTDRLPRIDHESMQAVHHFLLQNQPASLDEVLPFVQGRPRNDACLLKLAVHNALQQSPDRFENIGTPARPLWQARLPAHDKAQVTHFAFDPQTFEILCRPGQRLSQRLARRLQELDLYAHVVTFPEWHLPARS